MKKIIIDGRETTIRAFADNAGMSYNALRQRMRRRGGAVHSSEALLTDARAYAARVGGMNKRDHAKRARIAELIASGMPKVRVAKEVGISRARLYQILGKP